MPNYETVFIARQDLSDKQVNDLTEKFSQIIIDQGGRVHKTEYWGLRTLAYRINKNRKGHYVLIESESPAAAIIEMERNIRLNEDVLRSLTTRIETLSEGPSVMMERSSRGEDTFERPERPDRAEREAA